MLSTWNADLRLAIGASNGPACKTYCPNGTLVEVRSALGYDLKDPQKIGVYPYFLAKNRKSENIWENT